MKGAVILNCSRNKAGFIDSKNKLSTALYMVVNQSLGKLNTSHNTSASISEFTTILFDCKS